MEKERHLWKMFSASLVLALLFTCLVDGAIKEGKCSDTLGTIKKDLEATWILTEWHTKDKILTPPKVKGRWIVGENDLTFVLQNQAGEYPLSLYGLASYTLDEKAFRLTFNDFSLFKESSEGIQVSHKPPFEGTLDWPIEMREGVLHLGPTTDNREIIVDNDQLIFKKDGKHVRTWRRARAN